MSTTELPTRLTPSARPTRADRPTGANRSPGRRIAVDAVLAGLALPLAAVAAADTLNPQWSWAEVMASHFVHGRAGWLIPAALVSLAAASAALVWLAAPATQGGRVGLWLLGVWAGCVLAGGVFPADPYGQWDRPPSLAGAVHGVAALTAFAVLPVAAVVLTRVWWRDSRWRRLARPLTVTSVLAVAAYLVFTVISIDVMTDGPSLSVGPFHTLAGLAERVMLWSYVAWLTVVAAGVRRIARDG